MTAARTRTGTTNLDAEAMRLLATMVMRSQFLHLQKRGKTRGAATPENFSDSRRRT